MPIEIREPFHAIVPDGVVIGVAGVKGSGKAALLRAFAEHGAVMIYDRSLDGLDGLAKGKAAAEIEGLRRAGTTVLLASHDEALLLRLSDEVWWLQDGALARRGDPREVLAAYRSYIADQLAGAGQGLTGELSVAHRRGDGRAEVTNLETLDAGGQATAILRSGQAATVRVELQYHAAVESPVVGIMIRTRVGFEVYGTNTQLEGLTLGPQVAGSTLRLGFTFGCELCPGDYTVTVASHDPDGTPHDWLDDAIAFSVADSRYTAGVANLHATVKVL